MAIVLLQNPRAAALAGVEAARFYGGGYARPLGSAAATDLLRAALNQPSPSDWLASDDAESVATRSVVGFYGANADPRFGKAVVAALREVLA
jgi:hypothetical protein